MEDASYDRGHVDGGIEQRLAGHDKHFGAINGSLADIGSQLHNLTLAVQRLADASIARDATVVATAKALKEAEEARRDKTEQSWSPVAKVYATVAAVGGVAGLVLALSLASRS